MTIGLKDLVYATITEGENSVPTYGTPKKLAEVRNNCGRHLIRRRRGKRKRKGVCKRRLKAGY